MFVGEGRMRQVAVLDEDPPDQWGWLMGSLPNPTGMPRSDTCEEGSSQTARPDPNCHSSSANSPELVLLPNGLKKIHRKHVVVLTKKKF